LHQSIRQQQSKQNLSLHGCAMSEVDKDHD